jgi:glucokinase
MKKVIGIDLGGTNLRAAVVDDTGILEIKSIPVKADGKPEEVIDQIFSLIRQLPDEHYSGVGVGVPGPVDVKKGIVYELINIPSWIKVDLKDILEGELKIPVMVNNDANCFAFAEKIFGKGKNADSMVGLTIGTGIAGGVIVNGKLYEGANCGAGEFGMIRYLDHYYEYYCSGQFFKNVHNTTGKEVAEKALRGDRDSLKIWDEFGKHLGYCIETILYSCDPEMIIIGGSISKSFDLYKQSIWKVISGFAFQNSIKNLRIEVSELDNPGLLGAAALVYT